MPRVLLGLSLLLAAPACQQAAASRSAVSAHDQEVAARLDALEGQVRRIHADDKQLTRAAAKTSHRIASLARRLDGAAATLERLKHKLGDAGSATAAAAAAADSAASQAAELARRLAILEKRFEYHLKHDPGSA
jgi:septal ring factor EnvC (AmiA/AmiB activator)